MQAKHGMLYLSKKGPSCTPINHAQAASQIHGQDRVFAQGKRQAGESSFESRQRTAAVQAAVGKHEQFWAAWLAIVSSWHQPAPASSSEGREKYEGTHQVTASIDAVPAFWLFNARFSVGWAFIHYSSWRGDV